MKKLNGKSEGDLLEDVKNENNLSNGNNIRASLTNFPNPNSNKRGKHKRF